MGSAFPAVVSPGFSDESSYDDDHFREGDPEIDNPSAPLDAPEQFLVGVVPGVCALYNPPLSGLQRSWLAFFEIIGVRPRASSPLWWSPSRSRDRGVRLPALASVLMPLGCPGSRPKAESRDGWPGLRLLRGGCHPRQRLSNVWCPVCPGQWGFCPPARSPQGALVMQQSTAMSDNPNPMIRS